MRLQVLDSAVAALRSVTSNNAVRYCTILVVDFIVQKSCFQITFFFGRRGYVVCQNEKHQPCCLKAAEATTSCDLCQLDQKQPPIQKKEPVVCDDMDECLNDSHATELCPHFIPHPRPPQSQQETQVATHEAFGVCQIQHTQGKTKTHNVTSPARQWRRQNNCF